MPLTVPTGDFWDECLEFWVVVYLLLRLRLLLLLRILLRRLLLLRVFLFSAFCHYKSTASHLLLQGILLRLLRLLLLLRVFLFGAFCHYKSTASFLVGLLGLSWGSFGQLGRLHK